MGWREKDAAMMAAASVKLQERIRAALAARKTEDEPVIEQTAADVIEQANADRADDLVRYGMTAAMRAEGRRATGRTSRGATRIGSMQVWDE